ncbi:MAG: copper resistance protein CopC [Micrococcales bacterium]
MAALGLISAPLPVSAHAQLVNSNPKVSAALYKVPAQISLSFDDDLIELGSANLIQVIDPKNRKIQSGETLLAGATLSVKLKPSTILGKYKVIWRALSGDGHPVSGIYYFYLVKKK